MTVQQAQKAYAALPPGGQARFLATLAHDLTIWARDAYPQLLPDTTLVVERLRVINELQHRVTAHLAHLLEEDPRRYPDDVLVAILFDFAGPAACESRLAETFQELHAAYLRNAGTGDGTPSNPAKPVSTQP